MTWVRWLMRWVFSALNPVYHEAHEGHEGKIFCCRSSAASRGSVHNITIWVLRRRQGMCSLAKTRSTPRTHGMKLFVSLARFASLREALVFSSTPALRLVRSHRGLPAISPFQANLFLRDSGGWNQALACVPARTDRALPLRAGSVAFPVPQNPKILRSLSW